MPGDANARRRTGQGPHGGTGVGSGLAFVPQWATRRALRRSLPTANAMQLIGPDSAPIARDIDVFAALVPLASARIVELGCGNAELTRALATRHPDARITAFEVDRVQHAKNLAGSAPPNVVFGYGSADAIPLPDASCDVVLMAKSLHHVDVPAMDAALAEIARVFDVLKLDGITLLTSVDQRYIGHPDFEPVYEELDRRKAVVFIHPCYPPGTEAQGWNIPRMLIDYPFETTRVAVNLIFNGVIARRPNIKFILSHAGGTLPFLAHRVSIFDQATPFRDNYPEGALACMRRFWFDTALSGDSVPLAALKAIADPSRILFGTDYPYVSETVVAAETRGFDSWTGFGAAARAAIDRGNAEALFPRFGK